MQDADVVGNADVLDKHLSYPNGFAGDISLVFTLADFFNAYFKPIVPVEQQHIVTAPGAARCLETLLFNICDTGDAVLVPSPYWGMLATYPDMSSY